MYQSNLDPKNCKDYTEENFINFIDFFEKRFGSFAETVGELDISKKFIINWACIWNKPSNVGKQCRIVCKNDKYAFVIITKTLKPEERLSHFYRLEDLTILEES